MPLLVEADQIDFEEVREYADISRAQYEEALEEARLADNPFDNRINHLRKIIAVTRGVFNVGRWLLEQRPADGERSAAGPSPITKIAPWLVAAAAAVIAGVLAVPAGHTVLFRPGVPTDVTLADIGGDRVVIGSGGAVEVRGAGWAARLRLAPQPWRVVEVSEMGTGGAGGWRFELGYHTSSVPGAIRVENADGRWAELELTRLEWPQNASLAALPAFEDCSGW